MRNRNRKVKYVIILMKLFMKHIVMYVRHIVATSRNGRISSAARTQYRGQSRPLLTGGAGSRGLREPGIWVEKRRGISRALRQGGKALPEYAGAIPTDGAQ